jgi:hypothetical protein
MKTQHKIINTAKIIILGLIIGLGVNYIIADFTSPLHTPPTCLTGEPGCDTPLNVGNIGQVKNGGLTLGHISGIPNGLIVENGNVGIGTTSPNRLLTLQGTNATVMVRGAGFPELSVGNLIDASGRLSLYYDVAGTLANIRTIGRAIPIAFKINDAEVVRIDSTGYVGIGTTSPQAKLDVNGTARANDFCLNSDTTKCLSSGATNAPATYQITCTNSSLSDACPAGTSLRYYGMSSYSISAGNDCNQSFSGSVTQPAGQQKIQCSVSNTNCSKGVSVSGIGLCM